MKQRHPTRSARFLREEDGMITHFALVVMVLVLLFAGMSVDSTNAWRMKFVLQTAADATAHAAAMELQAAGSSSPSSSAKTSIRELVMPLANANVPGNTSHHAIEMADIEFGSWDSDEKTFALATSGVNAIRVTANRDAANSNALPTFFLRLAGLESWNIEVQSVAYVFDLGCTDADISTNGTFDITSNNGFYNGYCVEAADEVDLGNNNDFDDDNTIFVSNFSDVDFPGSVSMSTVVGRGTTGSSATLTYADIIEEKEDAISAPYVEDVDALADDYLDPLYENQPSYINTLSAVITIDASDVKYTSFIPGRIYEVECGGSSGSKAQFFNDSYVSEVVIVSECKLQLGNGSVFEDVVLVSRDTSNKSVYAASGVQLGEDDDCAIGGEVKIYTAGDVSSAANLMLFGVYISAAGEVQIAGQADGVEGLAIDADGDVSFSAQAQFGLCKDTSISDNEVSYFLVK